MQQFEIKIYIICTQLKPEFIISEPGTDEYNRAIRNHFFILHNEEQVKKWKERIEEYGICNYVVSESFVTCF